MNYGSTSWLTIHNSINHLKLIYTTWRVSFIVLFLLNKEYCFHFLCIIQNKNSEYIIREKNIVGNEHKVK